jgi:hypothetical protein
MLDEARAEWAHVPVEHPLLLGESMMLMVAGEVVAALGDRDLAAAFEARCSASPAVT